MARLHIYVDVKSGKTVSKYGVTETERVVFHNQHPTDTLVVNIEGATPQSSPLCKGQDKIVSFDVTVVEQKEGYKICKDFQGDTFKYSATIGAAATEDPIVIIENWSWSDPSTAAVVALSALGGAVVTYGIMKAMKFTRQTRA